MRRYRRSRSSGREESIEELFDTHGLEAEEVSDVPDEAFPLRPFSQEPSTLEEPGTSSEAVSTDPVRLYRRAKRAARGGRHSDALQAYQDLLDVEPNHLEGRLELARLLEVADDTVGAESQLDYAVDLAPDRADVVTERAAFWTRHKHFVNAEADIERALSLDQHFAKAHFQGGVVKMRKGRYPDAVASFERAVEQDDSFGPAWTYLGEALNQVDDIAGATQALQRAIAIDPRDARAYQMLGRMYDRLSRPDEAMEMYQKAREVGRS